MRNQPGSTSGKRGLAGDDVAAVVPVDPAATIASDAPTRRLRGRHFAGVFWIGLYLLLTGAPLLIAVVGMESGVRSFWTEFSVALGFLGLTMICLQFALTARFRGVASPYGVDVILEFHRLISIVAVGLILAHPVILFITNPGTLALLNVFEAPWRARMAVLSTVALVAIVVTSMFRQRLKLRYELWKTLHGLLAVVAVFGAFWHVIAVGHYLSHPMKTLFWGLMLLGTLFMLLYVRFLKPLQILRRRYIVKSVTPERGDSWTLSLAPVGHGGMRFRPGQFAWLTLGASPFAIEDHPFSFSSSAERRDRIELTIKELGDFSSRIKRIRPGAAAWLQGPHGVFTLDRWRDVEGYVFLAGGVGVTPVMSMLRTLADRGSRRPVLLLYGSRDWEGVTFRESVEELKARLELTVVHVLENPPEWWEGEAGFIDAAMLERHLPEDRAARHYFLCGPPPLMDAVERALLDVGVPLENIEAERFNLV